MNPELLKSIEDGCIVNIKSEGTFDKLRSECIGEIQKEFQFQQLRSQIEEQTINYIKGKRDRSTANQPKSEVRGGLRTYLSDALNGVLMSQMESLIDSMVKSQESYMREIVQQTVESIANLEIAGSPEDKLSIIETQPDDDKVEPSIIVNDACNNNNNNNSNSNSNSNNSFDNEDICNNSLTTDQTAVLFENEIKD